MIKNKLFLLFAAALSLPLSAGAQYYGDRPLEMSFEQSDMFFTPSFINPMGNGQFKNVSLQSSGHPLSELQRNPANAGAFFRDTLPGNYFYIDFGSSHSTLSQRNGYIYPYDFRPGPWYNQPARPEELTPVLSAAWMTRLPVLNNSVSLGATYQLITQGEHYYAIPHDIYKNMAGRSLDGAAYAGTEGYEITDRYAGADEMYHEGHALNAFVSWQINEALAVGFRAGRFMFERDGSFGSNNLWTQQIDYQSHWKSNETRSQEYDHTDFSLGMVYSGNRHRVGLHAGVLTGNATQLMARDDDSKSLYGQPGNSQYNNYQSWYLSDQLWKHEGQNIYAGLLWEKQVRDELSFRFMYNISSLANDLVLESSIESESDNTYYYQSGNYLNESEGFSKMHDFRNGTGERTVMTHRAGVSMDWHVNPGQRFIFGAIYNSRNQLTNTSEYVDSYAESSSSWSYTYQNGESSSTYYSKAIEDKTINWEYKTRLRSIQLPLMFEFGLGQRFEVLAGISRTMNFWKTENTSLILYDYRERIQDQQTKIEYNTGERITEPRERLSVINTNLIGGVSFLPTPLVRVQLIVSPGLEKNSLMDEYTGMIHVMLGMSLRL